MLTCDQGFKTRSEPDETSGEGPETCGEDPVPDLILVEQTADSNTRKASNKAFVDKERSFLPAGKF